ncbi:hypothetical protein ACS0TY_036487 [Phlomoides rotata]
MGSLMAGWDSHALDPNDVKFRRNKSLTKDEIGAYWKSKKQNEEEHLRDISLLSPRTHQKIIFEDAVERSEGASTEAAVMSTTKSEPSLEKIILLQKKNGWWMRSNSAFLNESPVIGGEGTGERYATQFHVADMAGSSTP